MTNEMKQRRLKPVIQMEGRNSDVTFCFVETVRDVQGTQVNNSQTLLGSAETTFKPQAPRLKCRGIRILPQFSDKVYQVPTKGVRITNVLPDCRYIEFNGIG